MWLFINGPFFETWSLIQQIGVKFLTIGKTKTTCFAIVIVPEVLEMASVQITPTTEGYSKSNATLPRLLLLVDLKQLHLIFLFPFPTQISAKYLLAYSTHLFISKCDR
jgi:hypothetical protein